MGHTAEIVEEYLKSVPEIEFLAKDAEGYSLGLDDSLRRPRGLLLVLSFHHVEKYYLYRRRCGQPNLQHQSRGRGFHFV